MQSLALESFDITDLAQKETGGSYQEGYDAGFAEGQAAFSETQDTLQSEVVQAIADLHFNYAETRAEITGSLAPLFSAIVDKILPSCIDQCFALRIVDHLKDAASQSIDLPMMIGVHSSQQHAVSAAIENLVQNTVVFTDPTLAVNTATLRHEQGEFCINLDSVMQEIAAVLDAIQPIEKGHLNHG